MTFEEFLAYVREHVGHYCKDSYWEGVYKSLKYKTWTYVKKEIPYLAINAIGTDYVSKHG